MVSVGEPLRHLKYILTQLFNEKYLLTLWFTLFIFLYFLLFVWVVSVYFVVINYHKL